MPVASTAATPPGVGGGPKAKPPKPKQTRPPKRGKGVAAAAAGPVPAQRAAQAELDPVIAALTQAANDRAARAEAAITGLTDAYAHDIAGVDYGAPYQGAEQQQAAVDAALRQALTGGGADLAAGLTGRLSRLAGTSAAPAVDQAAAGLASQGASAGTTRLASGSASLGDLIAQEASAREFGTKMPGIAKLSGLQGVKQAEGNAQSEIASGTAQVESQLPSLTEKIKSDRLAAKAAKTDAQYKSAELALARDKAAAEIAQGNARIGIARENAATSAFRAQTSAAHDAALERMAEANYGLSAERLQLAQQKAMQVRKSGGLTAGEIATMRQKAAGDLQTYYHGVAAKYELGADGQRVLVSGTGPGSAKTYQEAIKSLMLAYPALGPKQVIGMANKLYKPGEGGRPRNSSKVFNALTVGGMFKKTPGPLGPSTTRESSAANAIVGLAHEYMGTPYVWGGESPKGFDCSGFAQFLYGKAGIRIPRTTYTQWQAGRAVPSGQLAPGDLVFFKGSDSVGGLPGHVGIYIGGGKMIDAPHTGASVRVESVTGFGGYMGARRYG